MCQAAAVDTYAAGQHQSCDTRAVEQVVVIPVIGSRADDDQVLAVCFLSINSPLAGKAD